MERYFGVFVCIACRIGEILSIKFFSGVKISNKMQLFDIDGGVFMACRKVIEFRLGSCKNVGVQRVVELFVSMYCRGW